MFSIKTSIAAGAAVMILGLSACSNVEDGYHVADRSNLKLSIRPQSTQAAGGSGNLQNLSIINAITGKDTVYVDCPADWKVEIVPDQKPEEHTEWTLYIEDKGKNAKGSYFTFSSSINIKEDRDWPNAIKVFVEGLDGEELVPQYLTVRQERHRLVLTPTSFEIFPSRGGDGTITVESTDMSWEVESDMEKMEAYPAGWISIDRSGKENGTIKFRVHPNGGTSIRSASIRFLDGSGKIVADIDISQSGSTNTFDVYSSKAGNLLSQTGETFTVNVLSDKGWRMECAQAGANGWLSIEGLGQNQSASVGESGGAGRQITIVAAPNLNQSSREAQIAFIRTDDSATGDQGGVAPIYIKVIQAGTQQPALSKPWLEGEFTQKIANLYALYYSDFEVEDYGIEIRYLTEGSDFVAISAMGEASPEHGLMHVQLLKDRDYNGLQYIAGTYYEIRSYLVVKVDGASVRTISSAEEFRSPGVKPTNDDQTDPEVK